MECKLFVFYFIISIIKLNECVDQASFYGNSYISIPFKEAKSSTDLHFKFRTHLPNALVLLVAGTTDYCIVRLDNGRMKININLGAGESELISQHNQKLNDFKWHQVVITRSEADLSMTIDKVHRVQKHLPGRFFELNIHFGLFIGGHGNFTEIFFGHLDNFRGCLSELVYNGIPILDEARHRQSPSTVQQITWNCAAEFEANVNRSISFVEDDSFLLISHSIHKEIKIHFEIRTIIDQGLLFYNVGHGTKSDFLLIEIYKNTLKSVVKFGEKLVELIHGDTISDGHWHKINFRLTSTLIELTIDGKLRNDRNTYGHLFQMNENSYVGGLEIGKRFRAMSKGCKFCDISFKGCLRHFSISDKPKGLPDAVVTEGLLPGCLWQYPCLQNPCESGVCIQKGLDSFQCDCNDKFCVKSNYTEGYKVFSRNSLATELELLSVEPLSVVEGQSTIITTNNLHMILDYHKYGIKDSGTNFFLVDGPIHGSLTIDIWPHEKNSFSLSDIARDKVHYVHDGSEYHLDTMVLEIEFSPEDTFILPVYLQGRFRFSLSVNVIPVNDPPFLDISETTVLRIVQGSKKTIDSNILKVHDPDNTPNQLVYNVLKSDFGYFENSRNPSIKISSFTQEDVEEKNIAYIHNGNEIDDFYISLQVSDGIESSTIGKLRVSVSPQYWRLENNTGLIVLHETSAIITPYNLSFVSNAGNEHKIQFHIVKKPNYGVIEVEKNANHWESSDIFTGSDLKQRRVRYRHVQSKPDFDEFQFRLTVDKSSLYTFRLTFAKCTLHKLNSRILSMNETFETTLTSDYLSFQTEPIKVQTTSIHYVITSPPCYGYLFSSVSKYKLKSCDLFTQEDIRLGNLKYRLYQKAYSNVEDVFSFIVLSPGCNNITGNFSINYNPSNEFKSKVHVILKNLEVDEGSSANIDSNHLSIKTDFVGDLTFNITKKPKYGILQVRSTTDDWRNNTVSFSSKELKDNKIFYMHDDSETFFDHFEFMALSSKDDNFQYVNKFNINIILKNDNSPVRTIDKIFHVVVGGEKLLTGNDLKYADSDLDTTPNQIVYSSRELTNGYFYHIKNHSTKITEFTQDDLDNGRILFKHKGSEYGKAKLWISDGQFHVNGVLEIQASAPFIYIINTKKLIVEQGNIVVITEQHLDYSTNLFTSDEDVIYEVTNKPAFGKIVLSNNLKAIDNFTQKSINLGLISYLNEISNVDADDIGIRIKCKDAVNVANVGVWILPSNYWKPFEIKSNRLQIEESTSALINRNVLEVKQNQVPATAINYYITEAPDNGYITILDSKEGDHELINVMHFTQDLINDNRVLYIQSGANQTEDRIVFNVTNGLIWHNNLILKILIIPEQIYFQTNNLKVDEGGSAVLSTNHLIVLTDYYKTKINEYLIVKSPKYGCIQIHKRCNKFNNFSQKELQAGVIRYAHDGSETLQDQLQLVGISEQKRSAPFVLFVKINPINDQKPKLINNTGLIMWEGGTEIITNTMLAAIDEDLPKENLIYNILGCWWGSIVSKNESDKPINNFTQDLIDKNLILFKHQNGSEAKFNFNVSDGLHSTKEYTFCIRTKPVRLSLKTKSLHIFPLQKKYITSSHLSVEISDPHRVVVYEIITPPTLGRLMMESKGIYKIASSFTQKDLNESRIFYEHTHQFSDLYENDSFTFNVKANLVETLKNQLLKIDITVSSGGLDAYVVIPKIHVDEGGMTHIPLNISGVVTFLETHAGLRSPIIHAMAQQPQHGQIFLMNHKNITTFTQQQLESGQVYYEHDHSDTLSDSIHISLYLIPGYVILSNISIPININPINDQPFNLITPGPSFTVVQGENHVITRDELCTEDADTPASNIKYGIISGPCQGSLVLLPDAIPVLYFTQADIDNNSLVYIHNTSVLKDLIHFRVWDEKFRPQYSVVNIIITPINLVVQPGLPVYLQQGSDVVFLSEKQFYIETNADKDKIVYSIKEESKHGVIYVKDNPSTIFGQIDLKNENVMYLQTDMTTANDSFKVMAEIVTDNTSIGNEIEIIIKVQPLMQIKNFTAIVGESNRITLKVLDASPLAKLTNSNPRFTIIEQPKNTQLRKVIRSSGEKRNVFDTVISSFTHEEIQSGLIYLVVKDFELPWGGLQARLVFLVAASIFQPAIGELKINIQTSLTNDIYATLAGPNDPAGHEGGLHFASPNMTRDYFLIVSMVVGVVVLGVAVIVIIKCRSLETEEMSKDEQCLQPMPLPRPPDRLMVSSSPSVKEHIDAFTPTLPQCKVTPLNSRNDMESPHACYPYGVDEHPDDWSSCEASDPPCQSKNIMLRRNQYWV